VIVLEVPSHLIGHGRQSAFGANLGRLDVLVNNPAISHTRRLPGMSVEEFAKSTRPSVVSLDELRAVFETNASRASRRGRSDGKVLRRERPDPVVIHSQASHRTEPCPDASSRSWRAEILSARSDHSCSCCFTTVSCNRGILQLDCAFSWFPGFRVSGPASTQLLARLFQSPTPLPLV
jgi:hypothetical protein